MRVVHARRVFRRKAKAAHPDVGGSHAQMVELSNALKMVLSLSLRPERPRPAFMYGPFKTTTMGTTTTNINGATIFKMRFYV